MTQHQLHVGQRKSRILGHPVSRGMPQRVQRRIHCPGPRRPARTSGAPRDSPAAGTAYAASTTKAARTGRASEPMMFLFCWLPWDVIVLLVRPAAGSLCGGRCVSRSGRWAITRCTRCSSGAGAASGTDATLHSLRHTAAYRMAEDPALPLTDVQLVLGHALLTTAQLCLTPRKEDVIRRILAHHDEQVRQARQRAQPVRRRATGPRAWMCCSGTSRGKRRRCRGAATAVGVAVGLPGSADPCSRRGQRRPVSRHLAGPRPGSRAAEWPAARQRRRAGGVP